MAPSQAQGMCICCSGGCPDSEIEDCSVYSDETRASGGFSDSEIEKCAAYSEDKTRATKQKWNTAWHKAKLWARIQSKSHWRNSKVVESVETMVIRILSRCQQFSRQIIRNRALRWPYSKDIVELFECHFSDIEGNFGLGYLVYTHGGRSKCHQVLETSLDLRSVMHDEMGWFVRRRKIGHSYFHFSWNEARTKRQLDINLELMMDDLVATAQQQLLALSKFASDVNRYEGREALKVLYDPKACDRSLGQRLQECRLRFPKSTSKNLAVVCNHCDLFRPFSNSRDACSHCICLKRCWRLEGQKDDFHYHGFSIRACRQCFPYSLLYCRHCGHNYVYPRVELSSPSLSSDEDYTLHHSEDGTSTVAVINHREGGYHFRDHVVDMSAQLLEDPPCF